MAGEGAAGLVQSGELLLSAAVLSSFANWEAAVAAAGVSMVVWLDPAGVTGFASRPLHALSVNNIIIRIKKFLFMRLVYQPNMKTR